MENTLERMVERIYEEGIHRAEGRAQEIVAAAESRASGIEQKAQQEAEAIIRAAQEKAEALRRTTESDLELMAIRALSQLKSEISRLLVAAAVDAPVTAMAGDATFIRDIIVRLVENSGSGSLVLNLPPAMRDEIEAGLRTALQSRMADLEIRTTNLARGFVVARKGDGYELDFTEEALRDFLQPFLKPAISALFKASNG